MSSVPSCLSDFLIAEMAFTVNKLLALVAVWALMAATVVGGKYTTFVLNPCGMDFDTDGWHRLARIYQGTWQRYR